MFGLRAACGAPYAGAAGGGTVTTNSFGPLDNFSGEDAWRGTLIVPGYAFDLTTPTITAAHNKTVRIPRRARHARVTYTLTAQDDVDGLVRVTCLPRSGAVFGLGRTTVTCSATDASGNTGTASPTIVTSSQRGPASARAEESTSCCSSPSRPTNRDACERSAAPRTAISG
jgi:hypothetical protein